MVASVHHYLPLHGPRATRSVASADGTQLCVTRFGEGERVMVLSPGLATPPIVYDYIVQRFGRHLRFVTWDMRGTYRSDVPAAGASALRVEDSVADLEAVVEAEGLDHFILGGWSMGVQISLEYARRHPERCDGLALLNGGYGNILDHVVPLPGAGRVVRAVLVGLERLGGPIDTLASFLLGQPWFLRGMHATSFLAANPDFCAAVIRYFRAMDFGRYLTMIRVLHDHSAESYLPLIAVPTLVTAGGRDPMTPLATAEYMADTLVDCELLVVPDGTHYTPLEFPEVLNPGIERLIRRVYPDALPAELSD